jgi:acetyl esterase
MQALEYLQGNAERLQLDPNRVVIGGDSAGAQIAAQVGALVTTLGYAEAVGVAPTIITPVQLRGLVLACGQYEVQLPGDVSTAAGRKYFDAVSWAYSGKRNFLDDPAFATLSVAEHVTSAFPPALLTVGTWIR